MVWILWAFEIYGVFGQNAENLHWKKIQGVYLFLMLIFCEKVSSYTGFIGFLPPFGSLYTIWKRTFKIWAPR